MLVEIRLEVTKLLRKPRTYIGPVALTALVVIALIAVRYGNEFRGIEDRLARDFILAGSFRNAAFLTRFMLLEFVVYMLLPIFVCTVFGDLIASEAADGTLRTLLCRPITRLRLLASKYAVGIAYTFALTYGMGLVAYLVGLIFLGRGSLINLADGIWILPERMALLRLTAVYGLVAFGMVAIGSIAFAISTLLSNSNGAIAGAMGFVIGCGIVGQLDFFKCVKPYLLTTYLEIGRFIVSEPDIRLFAKSIAVTLVYSAVALMVGVVVFQRRDVLS